VAGGAVLGFVILHRDFEHVVATDADAMDLLRVQAELGLFVTVRVVSVTG
jgi:hypothetical protein